MRRIIFGSEDNTEDKEQDVDQKIEPNQKIDMNIQFNEKKEDRKEDLKDIEIYLEDEKKPFECKLLIQIFWLIIFPSTLAWWRGA